MNTMISLKEAANLVATAGQTNTFMFSGEMGIGKSSMLTVIAQHYPDYEVKYVDAALLDVGDIALPRIGDTDAEFVVNRTFKSKSGKPVLMMLDELGKATKPVINALLPLMLERRIGSYQLPSGSIVFGTTNLAVEGLGDNIPPHAKNRMTMVTIRKPNADEWLEWAANNDVAPEVMAWVKEYPHCLASFDDDPDSPYAFNPKRTKAAFVSPRSLHKASHIVAQRLHLSPDTLIAALAGTIGEAAARDMQAFLQLADALPEWARIMRDPETAPVPDSPIAQSILAFGAVTRLKAEEVDAWLTYVVRLKTEVAAMFVSQAMRTSKAALLVKNAKFTQYCRQFHWVYG